MSTLPGRARASLAQLVACAVAALVIAVPGSVAQAACPAAAGTAYAPANPSEPAQVVFRGHGWGHGLGMSQFGAQGAARLGCTAAQILTTYYTGASVAARADRTTVEVRMLYSVTSARVTSVEGNVAWRNGRRLVGTQRSGTWEVRSLTDTTAELLADGTRVWSGSVHRNGLRAVLSGSIISLDASSDTYGKLPMRLKYDIIRFTVHAGRMDVVKVFNDTSGGRALDKYLFGLAEVPYSWPKEALRAQAIAGRTYASQKSGVLRPTWSDQNYNGYDQEALDLRNGGHHHRAVLDTSGQIVVDGGGAAIQAFYTSSVGGYTEDSRYSFGGTASYLRPINDAAWDRASDNPASRRAWAVGRTRAQVAAALGFDTISSISVPARGSPARVDGVRVVGLISGKPMTRYIRGMTVRDAFGMLSPGFTITMTS